MTFKVVTESGEVFAPHSEPEKRAEGMSQEAAEAVAGWFSGGAYGVLRVEEEGSSSKVVARFFFSEQAAASAALLTAGAVDGAIFTAEHDPATDTHVVVRHDASEDSEAFTVSDFVAALQEKSDAYYEKAYPNLPKPKFGYHSGSRFYKVWTDTGTQRFVHCFVEEDTGFVFKAQGWKAPAKGVRYYTMQAAAEAFDGRGTGYLYAKK